MGKTTKQIFIVMLVITVTLFLIACGGDDPVQETMPTITPEATPELTPEPEPDAISFRFPFSFSSVDLQGNTITEEDLGEKELFFAYLWAVW